MASAYRWRRGGIGDNNGLGIKRQHQWLRKA